MKSVPMQAIKEIAPASGVAIGTLSGGIFTVLNYLPLLLGSIATVAGTILSVLLAWKTYNDIQSNKKLKRAELDDIKFRQKHDLPCRRCSDREE